MTASPCVRQDFFTDRQAVGAVVGHLALPSAQLFATRSTRASASWARDVGVRLRVCAGSTSDQPYRRIVTCLRFVAYVATRPSAQYFGTIMLARLQLSANTVAREYPTN